MHAAGPWSDVRWRAMSLSVANPNSRCRQRRKLLVFLAPRIRVPAQRHSHYASGSRRTLGTRRDSKACPADGHRSRRHWCLIQPATVCLPAIRT